MQMHWKRLDRDSSLKVIDSVKSTSDMGMFNIGTSEVNCARLPFYTDVLLYKVTNYASLPAFSFEYLGDGTFFYYLDGTADTIHKANDAGKLMLNQNNVLDYIAFYYERIAQVNPDMDEVTVIINPHDMPLLDSLDPAAYAAVMANFKPAQVTQNEDGGYTIEAAIYTEGVVMQATIKVNGKGRVTIIDTKMNMNEVLDSGTPQALV